jgi:hypothetical protein
LTPAPKTGLGLPEQHAHRRAAHPDLTAVVAPLQRAREKAAHPPLVRDRARRHDHAQERAGTSTNLVVSGLQQERAKEDPTIPVFQFFTITPYGLPYMAAVGQMAYILLFSWLLPGHDGAGHTDLTQACPRGVEDRTLSDKHAVLPTQKASPLHNFCVFVVLVALTIHKSDKF